LNFQKWVHRPSCDNSADERRISMLEEQAGLDVTYKVIYLARHGQGVHNVVCPSPSFVTSHAVHSRS
jgi:hypothetical protein